MEGKIMKSESAATNRPTLGPVTFGIRKLRRTPSYRGRHAALCEFIESQAASVRVTELDRVSFREPKLVRLDQRLRLYLVKAQLVVVATTSVARRDSRRGASCHNVCGFTAL